MQSESVGQRIRRARVRQGLSQSELAARVRVSQPTIANWEQDSHAPRRHALERVAQILGVESYWLVNGGGQAQGAGSGSFLSLPIRNVPLLDWPPAGNGFDPGRLEPRDYFAVSARAERCFALTVHDPAVEQVFPEGCIVVFDAEPGQLADGDFHLFRIDGKYCLRRYRASPERLQAAAINGEYDTVFVDETPRSYGRAVLAVRPL